MGRPDHRLQSLAHGVGDLSYLIPSSQGILSGIDGVLPGTQIGGGYADRLATTCAVLWTNPGPTGSGAFTQTIGILRVDCCGRPIIAPAYLEYHVWRERNQFHCAIALIKIFPTLENSPSEPHICGCSFN